MDKSINGIMIMPGFGTMYFWKRLALGNVNYYAPFVPFGNYIMTSLDEAVVCQNEVVN